MSRKRTPKKRPTRKGTSWKRPSRKRMLKKRTTSKRTPKENDKKERKRTTTTISGEFKRKMLERNKQKQKNGNCEPLKGCLIQMSIVQNKYGTSVILLIMGISYGDEFIRIKLHNEIKNRKNDEIKEGIHKILEEEEIEEITICVWTS